MQVLPTPEVCFSGRVSLFYVGVICTVHLITHLLNKEDLIVFFLGEAMALFFNQGIYADSQF